MLGGLAAIATVFYLADPLRYAPPWFHLWSGAAMFGAFFIATDPVTASATPTRAADLWRGNWHSDLHHSQLWRLSRWRSVFGAADEHCRADD
jgi:hypothetical protein